MGLGLFLQNVAFTDINLADNNLVIALVGLVLASLAIFLVIAGFIYIYTSLAYFAIGKKARLKSPGFAWIPGVGPLIIAYKTSKMHWWPWLLIIGCLIPVVGAIALLIFGVVTVVWHWKMFESIKRPGWWSILMLIPIVNFVIIGVAAWSKK